MSTVYSLPQISYWVAYRVLPHYAFQAVEKAIEIWTKNPPAAGPYCYFMACKMAELEPVAEDGRLYSGTSGVLGDHDYYLLEFPTPPAVDFSRADLGDPSKQVLAPYFSIILRHRATQEVRYYVLGPAPLGGGTTFRTVTAAGANANMGPGPAPQRELFLERVREALMK